MDNPDDDIKDAEVLEQDESQIETAESNDDENLIEAVQSDLTLTAQINLFISRIERLKEDAKPLREMLASMLDNSDEYKLAVNEAKKVNGKKNEIKRQILSTPAGKEVDEKIRSNKQELVDAQDALSYYLREYSAQTGLNEFEGEDGELRQIVYVAKLVRKTNLQK